MNVRRLTSPVEPLVSDDRPVPSTKTYRIGWTSAVTMRMRSWEKRIISRCQTTLIARRSWRCAVVGQTDLCDRRALRGIGCRRGHGLTSPGRSHRARSEPLAGGGLGVADRAPGVGEEHVVERRAGDVDRLDRNAELLEQPGNELLAAGDRERDRVVVHRRFDSELLGDLRNGASSSVWICTRSLPTLALSASGVSRTTILPWSMIAMRSQCSASSM